MVSNCYTASRREQYVLELQKYISVDVYGNCENAVKFSQHSHLLSCPKQLEEKCWNMIDEKYKVRMVFGIIQSEEFPCVIFNYRTIFM